jgi:hypothetical protein
MSSGRRVEIRRQKRLFNDFFKIDELVVSHQQYDGRMSVAALKHQPTLLAVRPLCLSRAQSILGVGVREFDSSENPLAPARDADAISRADDQTNRFHFRQSVRRDMI